MKKVFTIAAFAGLMSCGHEEKPIIVGEQFDFTQDQVDAHPTDSTGRFDFSQEEGVSDLLVYDEYEPGKFVSDSVFINNQAYIDSISQLESVNELLDYLETIPGYRFPNGPVTDRP